MSIRETQKRYCSRAMVTTIVIGMACIVLGEKAICKGLVLGTLFSVINFILMGETLPARMGQSRFRRLFLSPGSVLFRHILLAIPVVIAIRSETYPLVAVICGLFSVQIIILLDHLGKLLNIRKKITGIG